MNPELLIMQAQIDTLRRQLNDMQNANLMTPEFIRSIQKVASPNLAALSDVLITSPLDGQVLKYNAGLHLWINDTDEIV